MPSQLPVPKLPASNTNVRGRAVSALALGPPRILGRQHLSRANKGAVAPPDIFLGESAPGKVGAGRPINNGVTAIKARMFVEDNNLAMGHQSDVSPADVLVLSPNAHLAFTGPFSHRSRSKLLLTNASDSLRVAYKIKSTAPKGRLVVKPSR